MKFYKFADNNTNNSTFHFNNTSNTNYSKILDDLILADVAEKNSYLNIGKTTGDKYLDKMIGLKSTGLKDNIIFTNAITYITNNKLPFKYGETYELADGTPVIFFEDSIQIGFKLYYFNELNTISFLNNITPKLKKTIIDIYIDGIKISIIK